jgi:hypothetical protein
MKLKLNKCRICNQLFTTGFTRKTCFHCHRERFE